MRSIERVSTSTAGFVGITDKGPTTPEIVTSWLDFESKFGSYTSESFLAYAVNGFFTNGGQRCFVRRITNESDYQDALNDFAMIDEISILHIPNANTDVVKAAIAHCEDMKNRFLIIDAEQNSNINVLQPLVQYGSSKFAAVYFPWLKILHPLTGTPLLVPPGGFVTGIYARTDAEHGVWKAPANEVVRGASDVEFQIHHSDQDVLSSHNTNAIRMFPGKGILVWGARTLTNDRDWTYVNVRRLFNLIEESIAKGTRWVVSEPNNESVWVEFRESIMEFLTQCWRDGALAGTKAEEAFFVKCDRSTMTQEDIDNGKVICVIGIAPLKPAEFVIFRIGQWSTGTDISE
jgi:phage tail sheath protein FI